MVINQLFRKRPDNEIIIKLINLFGFKDINDQDYRFSKNDLDKMNIVVKINNIKKELSDFYIPCKRRIYMNDITIAKAITILRQFLKAYGYTLHSQEKYVNCKKFLVYKIISLENKKGKNEEKKPKVKYFVTFD